MEKGIHLPEGFRIALVGPESSGKTALAESLAAHFNILLTKEYAREYLTELERPYVEKDLDLIGAEQFARNENGTEPRVIDTELTTITIWSNEKFGKVSTVLLDMEKSQGIDLYLLCLPDIPWQEDPLRENPHDRLRILELYKTRLTQLQRTFYEVHGQGDRRFRLALEHIGQHFGKDF